MLIFSLTALKRRVLRFLQNSLGQQSTFGYAIKPKSRGGPSERLL